MAVVEVPELFRRAEEWVARRPLGCPAAAALLPVLASLTGPPRVGVCTLSAPLSGVRVAWPLVGLGASVDVVVVVHRGRLHLARPGVIVRQVGSVAEVEAAVAVSQQQLIDARVVQLAGEILSIAAREPALAASELVALARAARPVTPAALAVVFGPDAARVAETTAALEAAGVRCADLAPVAVAVAPPGGWRAEDAATLLDAARRTTRLVSTAPLPVGVEGEVVGEAAADPARLVAAIRRQPTRVDGVHPQLARRRAEQRLAARLAAARTPAELAVVAQEFGLAPPPRRRPAWLPGLLAGAGAAAGWLARGGGVAAVLLGVVVAAVVVAWRWRADLPGWLRRQAAELRAAYGELDITSRSRVPALAGAAWLAARAGRG